MDRFSITRAGLWRTALLLVPAVARAADDDLPPTRGVPVQNLVRQRMIVPAPPALNVDVDVLIFGRDVPAAKERLEKSIVDAIDEACRGYDLPEQIRHRIEQAAQFDKLRLLRNIENLREELEKSGTDVGKHSAALSQIHVLRKQQANLLDHNSFFAKSRKTLLARVPSINPEMTIDKMKRSRHRSNVDKALQSLCRNGDVTDDQRAQFMERVFEETLPAEPFEFRDLQLVKSRIGMIPRDKLEPLFNKEQWPHASKILTRFQESRAHLSNEKEFEHPLLVEHGAKIAPVRPPRLIIQRENERPIPAAVRNQAAPIVDPAFLLTRHRANVDAAIRAVERQVRLRPEQRTAVTELLLKEIQPPRQFGNFDDLVVQYSFSQLSDEQLKPLFDEDQWSKVLREFARIEQYRPMLKVHGLIHKASTRQFPAMAAAPSVIIQAADAMRPSNQSQD